MPTTVWPRANKPKLVAAPINPAAPVTNIFMASILAHGFDCHHAHMVLARQIGTDPNRATNTNQPQWPSLLERGASRLIGMRWPQALSTQFTRPLHQTDVIRQKIEILFSNQ